MGSWLSKSNEHGRLAETTNERGSNLLLDGETSAVAGSVKLAAQVLHVVGKACDDFAQVFNFEMQSGHFFVHARLWVLNDVYSM